jgi:ferredoxin-NADP reductase
MEPQKVTVRTTERITHDVIRIVTDKPEDIAFTPGQATEIAIDKEGWRNKKRPFTFTCLPENEYLEFTIKSYPAHHGVTEQLLQLKHGDRLLLHEVFGAIKYKQEGIFIAGGAGVTPFVAILRHLQSIKKLGNNKLLFSNKSKADIILETEFRAMLGKNFINVLSEEQSPGCEYGIITADMIREYTDAATLNYYLCGPPAMMKAIEAQLQELNVAPDKIVKEAF